MHRNKNENPALDTPGCNNPLKYSIDSSIPDEQRSVCKPVHLRSKNINTCEKSQVCFTIFSDYVSKKIRMSEREKLLQHILETDVNFWNHEFQLCLRDFDVRYILHYGLYRLISKINNRWKGKKIYIDLQGLVTIPEDSAWMTFPRFIAMTYYHLFDDQAYLMLLGARKTGNKKGMEWLDKHEAEVDARIARQWAEDRKKENFIPTICETKKQNYTRQDLSVYKRQLRRYLTLKGIEINRNFFSCFVHNDEHPSAYIYDRQDSPRVYCPVCSKSWDIFSMSGLILGTSDFKAQLRDVKRTLEGCR